ncbi:alanine acetyltransferase [Brevibacillus sp. Leaf182]|nr:alanine acetyltransferase [Brevibacillus sp. Leaf182]
MSYLKRNAPDKAFIALFSTYEGQNLYEKYDFKQYPAPSSGEFLHPL